MEAEVAKKLLIERYKETLTDDLERILEKIADQIKKGKDCVCLTEKLNPLLKKELENLGYGVGSMNDFITWTIEEEDL